MKNKKSYPIIVIGAGAAGLVVAIGASKAHKKVLLIEKGLWGGDCTNYGCIPSKSLIASANSAYAMKEAANLGFSECSFCKENKGVFKRVKSIVESFNAKESAEELEKLGNLVYIV